MKKNFYTIFLLLAFNYVEAQTITTAIKAGFGVDGELEANYFNNFPQSGNDDWFNKRAGSGVFVIDTTGAANIVSQYTSNPASRNTPFYRTMKYAPYSVVNNKMLIDAVFIRDYHGNDSTTFTTGASKNGNSPANWVCPAVSSIPDKNDILDMMAHVRRAGPNTSDSLWFFGGVSIENTNGDRYLDFEMYQTDIYYDRASQKFYGYGPDAGHTSWKFDAAGNITQAGDIIFSTDYGGSSLSYLQARIWIDSSSLSINPQNFDWDGTFDGASNNSQYGYAGIQPKSAGIFYTGYESPASTWAGPFSLIRADNSLLTTYLAHQYLEFSVNLSKLGLDPVTLLGEDACGMPFRRILVKTRSSTSFTAQLEDFIGPFDFFLAPRALVASDQSVLCGLIQSANISVTNPVSTSVYTWFTPNGHIASTSPDGTSITVDSPGTYIVTQRLQSGCSVYATDTSVIFYNSNCFVLNNNILQFNGNIFNSETRLNWTVSQSSMVNYFEIERSVNGSDFTTLGKVIANTDNSNNAYSTTDSPGNTLSGQVYYRIKVVGKDGRISYSKTIRLSLGDNLTPRISVTPNPVKDIMQLNIFSSTDDKIQLVIYDFSGKLMRTMATNVSKGNTTLTLSDFGSWPRGIYSLKVVLKENTFTEKFVLAK